MAQKKTAKRSTKQAEAIKQAEEKALQRKKTRDRQITAIVLFAVGLVLLFISLIAGESFWKWLHDSLFGLFGWCGYLIAPIMIYIAVILALDRPETSVKFRVFQGALLILLLCGLTQTFTNTPLGENGFFNTIGTLYTEGMVLKGGGVFAAVLGWPLLALFGSLGAKIIVIVLIFVLIMLLTGATLIDFFRVAYKPVKKIEQGYKEISAARKKPKFNVDIPIEAQNGAKTMHTVEKYKLTSAAKQLDEVVQPTSVEGLKSDKVQEMPKADTFDAIDADEDAIIPASSEKVVQIDDIIQKLVRKKAPQNAASAGVTVSIPATVTEFDDENEAMKKMTSQEVEEETDQFTQEVAVQEEIKPQYYFPSISLLKESPIVDEQDIETELKSNASKLVETLQSFGVQTRITDICRGPAVTRYELQPSAGVKISKITGLADDIALNLAAAGVRIEAPIPNKAAVGIEVPNKTVSVVNIREIIDSSEFSDAKSHLTIALGKNIDGQIAVGDIAKMPHVLIAGATGSGKSVCINSIIMSILYKSTPDEVRLLMIDPKVVELGIYNGIPHLLVPVVTEPRKAAGALNWAVTEMLNRYKLFAENNVRDLKGYNAMAETRDDIKPIPQIVIIIDELSDLMMAAPNEVEDAICRLAQMARAAGMHLVIATQRPSVDVITGVIKANIPSRIAFAVSSQVDSRTIIDSGGAEKLLGRGDMLFFPAGTSKPIRVQGCFVSDKEVETVVEFIKSGKVAEYDEKIISEIERQAVAEKSSKNDDMDDNDEDEMLPAAIECVVEAGQASTSLLQRRLKLGYARAARIIDQMENRGIVGPFEGSKPRQVLITRQQWIEMTMRNEQ